MVADHAQHVGEEEVLAMDDQRVSFLQSARAMGEAMWGMAPVAHGTEEGIMLYPNCQDMHKKRRKFSMPVDGVP